MYIPESARNRDAAEILELIENHPLATVMTYDESGRAFFSHLPLIVRPTNPGFSLLGHLSSRNPQAEHLRAGRAVKTIFHGPSAYISPSWYRSGPDVPTWNYAVVHIDGQARMIESHDGLINILKTLSERFDDRWAFELPADLAAPEDLCRAIVGFEIEVAKIDAKFKLAQSKPAVDRANVVAELAARTDDRGRALAELMRRRLRP